MKKLNVNINGNKKLVNNEKVRYMIWNLPAQKTCPYATENCKKLCYARKAERVYPQVLPSREKNYEESLKADFVENMIFTIESYLNSKSFKGKKAVFRIHESGDFYNLEYTEKWIEIVKHFENDKRITFLTYTKSICFFVECGYTTKSFPVNLIVRASVWNDTKEELLYFINYYNFPIYTAMTEKEMKEESEKGHAFFTCKCENCSTCLQCINKKKKDIICKIH